jgi:hypothetical protein
MSAIEVSHARLLEIVGSFDAPVSADDLATVCRHPNSNRIIRILRTLATKGKVCQVNGGWRKVVDVELDMAREAATILARFYARAGDKKMAQLMEIERERLSMEKEDGRVYTSSPT